MERKAVVTEFKVDTSQRIIEGYASIFGNRDHVDDVVVPGAFKKTLQGRVNRVKVMRDHEILIGKALHAEEDSTGLFTRSQISKTPEGDTALTLVADGVLDSMSFQYQTIIGQWETHTDGNKARMLKELKLLEFGPVTFPCNEAARITGVKSLEDIERAFHDFKAQKISAKQLAALLTEADPEAAPLAAPADQPEMHEPDTSVKDDEAEAIRAFIAEVKHSLTRLHRAA